MRNINNDIRILREKLSLKKGDIIYIVSHKKKTSALAGLLDFATGGILHLIHSYQGGACWYCVATSEHGTIYQVKPNGELLKIAILPDWSLSKKNDFYSETIDNIQYKRIRKVPVDE